MDEVIVADRLDTFEQVYAAIAEAQRKAFFEQTTPTNLRSSTDGRLAFHTIMEVQNESNTRKPQNVRIKKKKPSIPLALKAKKKPTVSTSFSQSGFNSDIPTTISNIKPTGAAIFDSSF